MEPSKQQWLEWLRRSYSEAPVEGPAAKHIKLASIHEKLSTQFPTDSITPAMSSNAVQRAFPNTQMKRIGHERKTYVCGVEDTVAQAGSSTQELLVQNELLSSRVRELEARVCELERLQEASGSNLQFNQQFDTLLQRGMQIVCGPDTPTHFTEFSMKILIDEKCTRCVPAVCSAS